MGVVAKHGAPSWEQFWRVRPTCKAPDAATFFRVASYPHNAFPFSPCKYFHVPPKASIRFSWDAAAVFQICFFRTIAAYPVDIAPYLDSSPGSFLRALARNARMPCNAKNYPVCKIFKHRALLPADPSPKAYHSRHHPEGAFGTESFDMTAFPASSPAKERCVRRLFLPWISA